MKNDTTPDWPQPLGIFESGMKFYPLKLLETIREVYDIVVLQGKTSTDDLPMEYEAFAKLLASRAVITPDGRCLFKLFSLEMPISTPSGLVVNHEGSHHLLIESLGNNEQERR